jgi:hypothetical protein
MAIAVLLLTTTVRGESSSRFVNLLIETGIVAMCLVFECLQLASFSLVDGFI